MVTHDGLEIARFKDDTTSNQDDIVAAGQERNTIRDKNPGFGCKQSARSDDVVCAEFIA